MSDREAILAAIENRRKSSAPSSPTPAPVSSLSAASPKIPHYADFDKDHDRRQEFRRLVDPGITRQNSREVAYEAIKVRSSPPITDIARAGWADNVLKTLLTLAVNVIDHPDDEKYHRFKPTNTLIRRKIVDPKGTLEYAVEVRATSTLLFHSRTHPMSLVCPVRISARGKHSPDPIYPRRIHAWHRSLISNHIIFSTNRAGMIF